MRLKTWIASATAALLTACGSVDVAHYATEKPTLELPTFFNGTIDAWGIFQKRSGEVARRFIEKRLEVSLLVFLGVVVAGIVAVKYLF